MAGRRIKSSVTDAEPKLKKERADGQMTGLAGEFFVAAELLKRGLQTAITFGNAKAIDLIAIHPKTGRKFTIQVKAVRSKNPWPISHQRVDPYHTYVFVVLNKPRESVEYFIVPGETLKSEPEQFTKWFRDPKFPGIGYATLKSLGYADAWHYFDASKPTTLTISV